MPRKRKVMMPRGAVQQKAEWSGSRGSYLTAIPNLAKDTMEEMEVFAIREPFTYARILYDHDRSEYIYEVWEPHLDAREKEFLDMIKDSLNRTLEYEWDKMAEKDKKEYIEEAVDSFIKSRGLRLEPASKDKIVYYIIRDFVGYGPVDVLMADLRIEDVSCDGTSIPLFVFHQKYESIKTNVIFDDDDALNSFVVLLGQRCAKQISVANPILDGTSVEGHRVQATYSREVTTRGSSFTIRPRRTGGRWQGRRGDRHVCPRTRRAAATAQLHRRGRGPREGDVHDVQSDGDRPPDHVDDACGLREVHGQPAGEPADQHAADPAHGPELRGHPDARPDRRLDRATHQANRRARRIRTGDERTDHEHGVRMGRRHGHLRLQGALVLVRRDHGNEEHDPRRDGGGVRPPNRHCQVHGPERDDGLPRDREDRCAVLPVPGRNREAGPRGDGTAGAGTPEGRRSRR